MAKLHTPRSHDGCCFNLQLIGINIVDIARGESFVQPIKLSQQVALTLWVVLGETLARHCNALLHGVIHNAVRVGCLFVPFQFN